VPIGSRHPALVKKACEYGHCVDTFEELLADLMALRDLEFEEAGSVSDDEGGRRSLDVAEARRRETVCRTE
jgi:hypothetical protein